MSLRLQRSLQALLLAGLGLFLLQRLWTGALFWYINQRFLLLELLTAVALLGMARAVLPAWRSEALAADHSHDGHEHAHARGSALSGWSLLIVALPLVLGLLVPARPLGSTAVANKGLNTTTPLTNRAGASGAELSLAPVERSVLDWVRAFNYAEDPGDYAGQPADVIGFVYHDRQLGSGEFLVSRFAVTCCSADAVAVGMFVRWPQASGLESNAWVRVQGAVQVGSFAGRRIPAITATSVEGVVAPVQPYLYP
jgi:uncharacterized repeat protein (TIGR03943 family)